MALDALKVLDDYKSKKDKKLRTAAISGTIKPQGAPRVQTVTSAAPKKTDNAAQQESWAAKAYAVKTPKNTGNIGSMAEAAGTVAGKNAMTYQAQAKALQPVKKAEPVKSTGKYGLIGAATGEQQAEQKIEAAAQKPKLAVSGEKWLGANAMAGIGQFNKQLASTADLMLPDVITPKAVQKTINYYKDLSGRQAQEAEDVNRKAGTEIGGQVVQGVVSAIPNAVIAGMTAGAGTAAQGGSLAAKAAELAGGQSKNTAQLVSRAFEAVSKNPSYWTSFAQTLGTSYDDAKNDGASELQAQASALLTAAVNAGVEIGGGIEGLPKEAAGVKNWVKSMFDEGKEEVVQGAIENLTKKAVYDKDRKWYSEEDQGAVLNPKRAAQEFGGGASAAGILGLGQMGMQVARDADLQLREGTMNRGTPYEDRQKMYDEGSAEPKAQNAQAAQDVQTETDEKKAKTDVQEDRTQVDQSNPTRSDLPQRERREIWNYADRLRKDLNVDGLSKDLKAQLEDLYSGVKKTGWDAASEEKLDTLAGKIMERSGGVIDEDASSAVREAKKFLRNTKIYVTPQMKAEIEYRYGDYNAFRKSHMGQLDLKLVNGPYAGQSVDAYYSELADMDPVHFPQDLSDMNDADILGKIVDFTDNAGDVYTDPFAEDPEGAKKWIADKIKNGYEEMYTHRKLTMDEVTKEFEAEKKARELADATEKQAKLTLSERELVKDMLSGKADPNAVTDKRILDVYEARKDAYNAARNTRTAKAELRERYRTMAEDTAENSTAWNDKDGKLSGWRYDLQTAERNIRDVVTDDAEAEKIVKDYFVPVHQNEAGAVRMKNTMRETLKGLDLDTKKKYLIKPAGADAQMTSESGLVQMYGEKLVTEQQLRDAGADAGKIMKSAEIFRTVYNQLYDMANRSLIENGYSPLQKRADYFPHFSDAEPTGFRKVLAKLGMKIDTDKLPTDIAGITDTYRPGKKWVANFLQRTGTKTDYDALQGFDRYVDSVGDVIWHTDDIQRLRALETAVRYNSSDSGIQQRVRDVMEDPTLDEDARDENVRKIFDEDRGSLSNFVTWLRKYTDTLAGKKNFSDRDWEYKVGRGMYNTMSALEKRISANMVGGNISSALTNFIPIFQGAGEVKATYMMQAMKDAAMDAIKTDGFADQSDFLTNRFGSEKLSNTGLEKLTNAAGTPFEMIDHFTAETLTRAKYMQNVDQGMSADDAMADADSYAAAVIADRSKGSQPVAFNEKNPVAKMFTMFNLENSNQFQYLFKDLPRNMKGQGIAAITGAMLKLLIATGVYGELFKKMVGYDPTFNPLSLLGNYVAGLTDNEADKKKLTENMAAEAVKEVPFVGNLIGGGRLPVGNVVQGAADVGKDIWNRASGKTNDQAFAKELAGDLAGPASMLLLPMGGNQIKKTIQGAGAYQAGAVYGNDSQGNDKLKYLVDKTPANAVRGALFGRYAFPQAQEYVDSGFKSMTAKNTQVLKDAQEQGIGTREMQGIIGAMGQLKTKAEKLDYLMNRTMLTAAQKQWVETSLMESETPRDYTSADSYDLSGMSESAQSGYEAVRKMGIDLQEYQRYYKVINGIGSKNDKMGVLQKQGLTKQEASDIWDALHGKTYAAKKAKSTQEKYSSVSNEDLMKLAKKKSGEKGNKAVARLIDAGMSEEQALALYHLVNR